MKRKQLKLLAIISVPLCNSGLYPQLPDTSAFEYIAVNKVYTVKRTSL